MADVTLASAIDNPDIYFIGVDQFVFDGPPNLTGLQFREDQMGYAMGVMAVLMSESGTIGGIFGQAIPPVVKFRNGYVNGALATNPDIEILDVYIDSFTDPARGAAAAEQFIGEGADVIFGGGGLTGSGGIAYAAAQGVKVIGVDQDEYFTTFGGGETPGAENIISSAVKRLDNAVYASIEALVNGGEGFAGGTNYIGDVTNGGVAFAPANDADVPAEVTAAVEAAFDGLAAGTIVTGVSPATGEPLPNLVETAAAAEGFATLLAAAEAAGLVDNLATGGPFTIFAPTDEAFAAALESMGITAADLLGDTETLTDILLYHVVPAAPESKVVVTMDSLPTAQGSEITLEVVDGVLVLNGSVNVVAADIVASNGIIHVIDGVLLPPQ
jgi:basic membrane lipoprotein Med (substrate-binding protein (PBP1-ABC) superfamily)